MPESLAQARARLKMSQSELSQMLNINQAFISQIESGRRQPTPIEQHRLKIALGENIIFPMEEITMTTPQMPQARWNADGSPNFKALDTEDKELQKVVEDKNKKKLTTANERAKTGARVPDAPVAKWTKDGAPDYTNIK